MKNAIVSINGSSSDELFKKMASPVEGWSIKNEGVSKDVPLNDIDYFATQLLSNTVSDKTKTVLTAPKIMPGTVITSGISRNSRSINEATISALVRIHNIKN